MSIRKKIIYIIFLAFCILLFVNHYTLDVTKGKFSVLFNAFNKIAKIKTSNNGFVSLSLEDNIIKILPNSTVNFGLNDNFSVETGAAILRKRGDGDINLDYSLFLEPKQGNANFFRVKLPKFDFDISSDVAVDFILSDETKSMVLELTPIDNEEKYVYYGFFIPYHIGWEVRKITIKVKICRNGEKFIEIVKNVDLKIKDIVYQKLTFSLKKSGELKNANRDKYKKEQKNRYEIYEKKSSEVYFYNGFRNPLEIHTEDLYLTSDFGQTREWFLTDGTKYSKDVHYGIDYSRKKGTYVYAVCDGIIRYAENNTEYYGNMIIIDHGLSLFTEYCHLEKIYVK
ncbi:MAG TPA: M23 family metallopeptidase, partial [Spirochaetota bacterium]|nr:M23 family metallopeptidase [Spirochaetota bacterium]